MNKPIQITVGGSGPYDPVAGATDCNIPAIAGSVTWVEAAGYGPYPYSNYVVKPTGGFRLLNGDTFKANEIWFVHASNFSFSGSGSDFSNGFNYTAVINALFGRIGWRSSTLDDQPVLNSNNQINKSGRCFNDVHALVTIPNIKAVIDNPACSDSQFNAELEALQRSVIMRCLTAVFSEKEYVDQTLLYERGQGNGTTVTNTGLFCGYDINVTKSFNKSVQVDSVVLTFDSDITFDVYLFKEGKKAPIWQQEVTAVANEQTVVNLNDLVLNYINADTKGCRFFLGYFQDDIGSAKAVKEPVYCWNKTLLFYAEPFTSAKIPGQTDFDRNVIAGSGSPYGINLQVSSFNDWTSIVVNKPGLFDEMIALTMAYTIIEKVVYATTSNGTERILKQAITQAGAIQDLTGSAPVSDGPPAVTGLNKRIEREVKRVKESIFREPKSQVVSLC